MSLHHDSALAARRIEAHRAGELKNWLRALFDLNFGSEKERNAAWARIDTLPIRAGWWATAFRHPTDLKLDAQLMRRVSGREDVDFDFSVQQAVNAFARGRVSEFLSQIRGLEDTGSPTGCDVLAFGLTLGYSFPDSTVRRYIKPSRPVEDIPEGKLPCTGIYLIEQGRGEKARAVIRRLRTAASEPSELPVEPEADRYARSLEGYQAWTEGNLREAARRWSGFNVGLPGAIWRGDLYRQLGELQTAEDWYVAAWQHPVAHERLGRLYEKMGRPDDARAAYERFVEAWKDADQELQDRVTEAKERVEALGEKKSAE
jgi:tetratricopeptide (TPR) repeat protein